MNMWMFSVGVWMNVFRLIAPIEFSHPKLNHCNGSWFGGYLEFCIGNMGASRLTALSFKLFKFRSRELKVPGKDVPTRKKTHLKAA